MKTEEQKKQDELIRQLFNFLCLRYEIIKGEKFKQAYFAKKIGYEKSLIGKWKKGKSPIPEEKHGSIARFFDIDPIWFRDFKSLDLIFNISNTSNENGFSLYPINAPYFISHLGNYERYKYSKHYKEMDKLSDSISQRISDIVKDFMTLNDLEWNSETPYEKDPKRIDLVNSIRDTIEDEFINGSYSKMFVPKRKIDRLDKPMVSAFQDGSEEAIKKFVDMVFADKELVKELIEKGSESEFVGSEQRNEKEMIVLGHNMSFLDPDKEREIDLSKFLGTSVLGIVAIGDESLPDIDLSKPCKAKVIYEQYRLLLEGFVKRDPELMDILLSDEIEKDIELLKACFKNSKESNK